MTPLQQSNWHQTYFLNEMLLLKISQWPHSRALGRRLILDIHFKHCTHWLATTTLAEYSHLPPESLWVHSTQVHSQPEGKSELFRCDLIQQCTAKPVPMPAMKEALEGLHPMTNSALQKRLIIPYVCLAVPHAVSQKHRGPWVLFCLKYKCIV